MNRTNVYHPILTLLLWLLAAVGARAQSLEYWFDKKVSPQTIPLSGDGTADIGIDTKNLKIGLHTLHLRAKDGSDYSPVSSSTFLKVSASGTSKLEYWFDGDVKNLAWTDIDPETEAVQILDLKMDNNKQFPLGIHQLNMRVAAYGGNYSPVYSTMVMKMPIGSGDSVIEYWFDDNVDKSATKPLDPTTEEEQIIDLDLSDPDKFPIGLHQLNMRVAPYGGHYSAVYSAMVMKMPGGTGGSVLEYWFDDNYQNPSTIPVNAGTDGVQKLDLDLSNLDNFPYGLHKLNIRVAANGNQYSPVYSSIVMRYPTGPSNYLAYWLDDDYENLKRVKATASNTHEGIFEQWLNFSQVPSGMHRLHFRASRNAVDYGPVHEVPILVTRRYNQDPNVYVMKTSYSDDAHGNVILSTGTKQNSIVWQHSLNPDDFTVGQHKFIVSFQNSAEVWSEKNVTYFYKEGASGRLRAGLMPSDPTGIDDVSGAESFGCTYYNGMIYVDCQSPRLSETGVVIVCDMTGRVIAQQKVTNADGIHAEVSVEGLSNQILIVKLVSGDVRFSKKVVKR